MKTDREELIQRLMMAGVAIFLVAMFWFYIVSIGEAQDDCEKRGGKWAVTGADGHGVIYGCRGARP